MDLFAVIISAIALILSLFQVITDKNREKKEATLQAYNLLQNEAFDKISSMNIQKIAQLDNSEIKAGNDLWKEITVYLARIEHFSVGVNTKIYDLTVINRLGGNYLIGLYNRVLPIIDKKRELSKGGNHYNEFENLIISLKKKRKRI